MIFFNGEDHHFTFTFSPFSLVIMLTLINLVCAFVVIAIVTISPWIIWVVLSLAILGVASEEEASVIIFLFIISTPILFATYLFMDMTWTFAGPLILYSLLAIMTLLFMGYLLGFLIVFLTLRFRPWLKAHKTASSWVCQSDYTRYTQLGSGLPWLVRWSGRFLAVEVPKKHEDFAEYFVCRTCGKNRQEQAFQTGIDQIIGVIGDFKKIKSAKSLVVKLFSNTERQARNADIDRLEIHAGQKMDYDYAVNAVIIALSEDHNRPRPLSKVPVTLYGNPPLNENSRRLLAKEFGPIKEVQFAG